MIVMATTTKQVQETSKPRGAAHQRELVVASTHLENHLMAFFHPVCWNSCACMHALVLTAEQCNYRINRCKEAFLWI